MQKWTFDDIEKIRKQRQAGKTWAEIGASMNISPKTVQAAYRRNVNNHKLRQRKVSVQLGKQREGREDPQATKCTTRPMTAEEWAKYGPKNEIDRGSPLFWEAKRHTTERQRRLWGK